MGDTSVFTPETENVIGATKKIKSEKRLRRWRES